MLEWIFKRTQPDSKDKCGRDTAIGILPSANAINIEGLADFKVSDLDKCFELKPAFWKEEVAAICKYFEEQVGADLPAPVCEELKKLAERVDKMKQITCKC